jgi:DNA-binding response OmpR family regulator
MTADVVIIDDDRSWAETLADVLRDRGLTASLAHDGVEGYELVQATRPSLAILDIDLPRMSGIQVLIQLRQEGWSAPIVVISGEESPDVGREVIGAGANAFLRKPVSLAALRKVVRCFLPAFDYRERRDRSVPRLASVEALC